MSTKFLLGALIASSLVATGAAAQDRISYDYVGAQLVVQDLDDYNCDQDGLSVFGSASLNREFFVSGSVSDVSGDHCGSTSINANIGYQTLFGADSSVYGTVGVQVVDVDWGDNDSGLRIAGGVRGFVAPQLEARLEVAYESLADGNIAVTGGASYFLNRNVALVGEISLGTDVSGAGIGARYHF